MSINKILKMLDLRIRDNVSGVFAPDSMNTLRAHIRELESRAERAEAENRMMLDAVTDFIAFHDFSAQEKRPDVYQKFLTRLRSALAAMEATDE